MAQSIDGGRSEQAVSRKPWSVEESVALLQREKGKHFDPVLVDLFVGQLPAILEIKERYAEDAITLPSSAN